MPKYSNKQYQNLIKLREILALDHFVTKKIECLHQEHRRDIV